MNDTKIYGVVGYRKGSPYPVMYDPEPRCKEEAKAEAAKQLPNDEVDYWRIGLLTDLAQA